MKITQNTVKRIMARAEQSALGLGKPKAVPDIGKYEQHNLHTLGLLLVDCWDKKYDLSAVLIAALEIVAEDAGSNGPGQERAR